MPDSLLPARFLFRFAVPCRFHASPWGAQGAELGPEHRLPSLGELEGRRDFADVRVAWNDSQIVLSATVTGKKHQPWCRANRLEDSDSLQVWIDTRDTHNIHRASRFCHRLVFLPFGGGRNFDQALADQLLVDRARENANPMRPGQLQARSRKLADGWTLSAQIPAAALTGFHAADHPRLGFAYYLFDRELGEQTFSTPTEFPFASDPSLWGTLELVRG
jgi:hypothetical protein